MRAFIPVLAFAGLLGVMAWGLLIREDRDALPSAFIEKTAPAFDLPRLMADGQRFTHEEMRGKGPVVLNFWASWCAPCRIEHPKLVELAEKGVRVIGINYKNEPEKARAFLEALGNPFEAVAVDDSGRTGIEYGVAALPETFVLDENGVIIYKHVGPINPGELEGKIWPAIRAAAAR